jgi:hypothetical protein
MLHDKTTKRVLIVCTIISILSVGYFVYVDMCIEIEQYEDEIVEIGPPGATNLLPVFIIVLVCSFVCCIILKLSNRNGKELIT